MKKERKKERKKDTYVEILFCTKKFRFSVPSQFSAARARHVSCVSLHLSTRRIDVFKRLLHEQNLKPFQKKKEKNLGFVESIFRLG